MKSYIPLISFQELEILRKELLLDLKRKFRDILVPISKCGVNRGRKLPLSLGGRMCIKCVYSWKNLAISKPKQKQGHCYMFMSKPSTECRYDTSIEKEVKVIYKGGQRGKIYKSPKNEF